MTPSNDAVASALERLVSDLKSAGVAYALVGGLAFSQRGEPRTTYDVDVAVAAGSDAAAENILRHLHSIGYGDHAILEDTRTGRIATARLTPPISTEPVIVYLIFALCGLESEIVSRAEVMPVGKAKVAVAGRPALLAMKILSRAEQGRGRDEADVLGMLDYATDADLAETRRLLELTRERGFARGRDLLDELKQCIATARTPNPNFRLRKRGDTQ